jgi:hypothetical protein
MSVMSDLTLSSFVSTVCTKHGGGMYPTCISASRIAGRNTQETWARTVDGPLELPYAQCSTIRASGAASGRSDTVTNMKPSQAQHAQQATRRYERYGTDERHKSSAQGCAPTLPGPPGKWALSGQNGVWERQITPRADEAAGYKKELTPQFERKESEP